MVRNNNKARVTSRRKCCQWTWLILFKYFALMVGVITIIQSRIQFSCSENFFGVFGGGTLLAMSKTICALDTSSLKPGSGATEGVLD